LLVLGFITRQKPMIQDIVPLAEMREQDLVFIQGKLDPDSLLSRWQMGDGSQVWLGPADTIVAVPPPPGEPRPRWRQATLHLVSHPSICVVPSAIMVPPVGQEHWLGFEFFIETGGLDGPDTHRAPG
jgi:hypothetical protein